MRPHRGATNAATITAAPRTISVGSAVAHALARHGVTHVFGIPGIHTMEIYRGFSETGIRHVTSRHEQGAVFMADGFARSTGRPGVACLITGPGIANGATAIAEAYSDSVPLLILTTQIEREFAGTGRRRSHELFDQMSLLRGLTPNVIRAETSQAAAQAVDAAFASFGTERPVPAIVEIPIDVLGIRGPIAFDDPVVASPALPGPAELERALSWLNAAKRPLMIVGGGAHGAADVVTDLADRIGAGVVASSAGKGVVPDSHPRFVTTGLDLATVRAAVAEADVLVIVGCEIGHMDTYVPNATPWPTPLRTIQIDIDPTQIGRNAEASLGLVGDAAATVAWLAARVAPNTRTAPGVDAWVDARAASHEEAGAIAGPIAPWIDGLDAGLPVGAILTVDITRPVTYAALYLHRCDGPRTWLRPLGLTTLGYALPAAIGAAIAHPDRAVAALVGDGGFMFTVQEMIVASELGLALPVIVWNDGAYGEIRDKMVASSIPPIGTTLQVPDLPALARTFGGEGARVQRPTDLTREVRAALERPRPTIIEVDVR
jgi:thiamine pyrophosphate-dependent acetolactate synthase large subunit-like protein